jgi:hypothetical protein
VLGHKNVISQNLGNKIQTDQRKQATKPKIANGRYERQTKTEHNTVRSPLATPTSKASLASLCTSRWSKEVKSRNQQAAVNTVKQQITVTAETR